MSQFLVKKREEDNHDFKWGVRTRDGPSPLYSSFIFKGVTYYLYDCVAILHKQAVETDVGKIVKMWESPYQERKIKVVWFFRPRDITNFLGGYEPHWHELFLASGNGELVSSIIDPEKILGKCNVVCLSDDQRNAQPSAEDIRDADYHFRHVFDVESRKVSKTFPPCIDRIGVEAFFNRSRLQERYTQQQKGSTGQRALQEKATVGEMGKVRLLGSSSGNNFIIDNGAPVRTASSSLKHKRPSDKDHQLTKSRSWHSSNMSFSKKYRF